MVREMYTKIRGLEYLVRSKPLTGATGGGTAGAELGGNHLHKSSNMVSSSLVRKLALGED